MSIQIEGFAIVSEDGMVADSNGVMRSELIIEADQKFLSDGLDRADVSSMGAIRTRISRGLDAGAD